MSNFNEYQGPTNGSPENHDQGYGPSYSGQYQQSNAGSQPNSGAWSDSTGQQAPGAGAHGGPYQQGGPGNPRPFQPVGYETSSRFFNWVRRTYIRRSDDRWIGGVCGGLAERLGWSPALVRVIMLLCALCFGAGAAFYGFAWFILPDKRNVIVAEDLMAGRWRGAMVGIIICWIASIGSSWFVSPVIAALALWALLGWSGDQAKRYGWGYGPASYSGPAGGPHPFADTRGQGPMPAGTGPARGSQDAGWQAPASGQEPYGYDQAKAQGPMPAGGADNTTGAGFVPPVDDSSQSGGQRAHKQTAYSDSEYGRSGGGYGPSDPALAYTPPAASYVPPVQPPAATYTQPARVIKGRRKPAGPALVLISLGVLFLSALGIWGMGLQPTSLVSSAVRLSLLWVGGLALALGLLLMILGTMGRRSGGLIPVALVVLMVVSVVAGIALATGINRNELRRDLAEYENISLSGDQQLTLGSSKDDIRRYQRGLFLSGDPSAPAQVSVDLSQYEADQGTHQVRMSDGTRQNSGCPTGQMRIAASATQVDLKLPEGCSYVITKQMATNSLATSSGGSINWNQWIDHFNIWGIEVNVHGNEGDYWPAGHHGVSSPELEVKFTYDSTSRIRVSHEGTATLPQNGTNRDKVYGHSHNEDEDDDDDDD
ncbi:hypothetical protein KIM372_04290 [Bombiscardovia nodaiensis]|uniref:Phage shock protein PspC N-terminal domain-containing protein n=1 Tax=Bombiscardovia nodaiensis TaxID=2932181 RepID=A0ABN6SB92_9BIFI|nr:hypothetical protein KIM372_04290 [Bombiscardovia nodaiensis]